MTTIAFRGNLTAAPELRYTQSGKPVASVNVAENTGRDDQKRTHFHDVTLWGELAEHAAQLDKGTSVIVLGRLEQEEFTDREGKTRRAWKVTADSFGPDLRFATAVVTRSGDRQPANVGSWDTTPAGDDTPF